MRRRLAMLLTAALAAAGISFFLPASPASAAGLCVGALGTANTGAPLFYPGVSLTATNTTFVADFASGAGVCVHTPGGVSTTFTATGVVSGWCGLSSGVGVSNDGYDFAWVAVGGTLIVTGELTGVANAVPDVLNSESCLTGADQFIVTGVAALVHCMTKIKGLTDIGLGLHAWNRICVPTVILA